MTVTPGDDLNETLRQRTRDQFELLRGDERDAIVTDTDDPADFNYICSSRHLLVNPESEQTLADYFAGRLADPDDVFDLEGGRAADQPREDLYIRYEPPRRRDSVPGDRSILATLREIERAAATNPELEDIARPDHVVHICGTGRGSICPATEPTETGFATFWPPRPAGAVGDGTGVRVVVIDTGWYDPREDAEISYTDQDVPWEWLQNVDSGSEREPGGIRNALNNIRAYAGHGTFVAGVVRSMAPKCQIRVLSLPVDANIPGGGVFESDIVPKLDAALDFEPHLINLSAGCPTRGDRPARAFENWWTTVEDTHPGLQLVASAGNNSSPASFYPASFSWATGVGSLDRDGNVSDFSNWGDSVDVWAQGRNIVNAFPGGTYVCHECPDRGDEREFNNEQWLARWSGTSFSAPLVTGLIAAAMSQPGATLDARAASKELLFAAQRETRAFRPADVPVLLDHELSLRHP